MLRIVKGDIDINKNVNLASKIKTYRALVAIGMPRRSKLLHKKFRRAWEARTYGGKVLERYERLLEKSQALEKSQEA